VADRAVLKENGMKILLSVLLFLIFNSSSVSIAADLSILFHRFDPDGPWICSINPDGTGLKKIIHRGLFPIWSPDKRLFAYLSPNDEQKKSKSNTLIVSIGNVSGNIVATVASITISDSAPEKSDLPGYYEWSPNGKKIALVSTLRRSIYVRVFNIESKQSILVYTVKFKDFDLAQLWSIATWLDDDRLLFSHGSPETPGDSMRLIDLKTRTEEAFVNADKETTYFFDNYGGKVLAISMSTKHKNTAIFIRKSANTYQEIIRLQGVFIPISKIVHENIILRGSLNSQEEILLVNLKNKKATKLTPQPFRAEGYSFLSPVFSPDGSQIIVTVAKGMGFTETSGVFEEGQYIYDLISHRIRLLNSFKKQEMGNSIMAIMLGQKIRGYSW
jgi:hypothetical protein